MHYSRSCWIACAWHWGEEYRSRYFLVELRQALKMISAKLPRVLMLRYTSITKSLTSVTGRLSTSLFLPGVNSFMYLLKERRIILTQNVFLVQLQTLLEVIEVFFLEPLETTGFLNTPPPPSPPLTAAQGTFSFFCNKLSLENWCNVKKVYLYFWSLKMQGFYWLKV